MEADGAYVPGRSQTVRRLREALVLFADASNLEAIMPPSVGFRIPTPRPIHMAPGLIDSPQPFGALGTRLEEIFA